MKQILRIKLESSPHQVKITLLNAFHTYLFYTLTYLMKIKPVRSVYRIYFRRGGGGVRFPFFLPRCADRIIFFPRGRTDKREVENLIISRDRGRKSNNREQRQITVFNLCCACLNLKKIYAQDFSRLQVYNIYSTQAQTQFDEVN